MNTQDYTSSFTNEDINANKAISILSYLGFLFLIPLFARKNSPYAKFHVNQGLVLFIVEAGLSIVQNIVDRLHLGLFSVGIGTIFAIVDILMLVLCVIGILNLINGKAKELPIIGKIRILK